MARPKNEFYREVRREINMLNMTKNITLSGTSIIDGVQIAYMSANISTDGGNGANANKTITNQEVYNANKAQVRADIAAFENRR